MSYLFYIIGLLPSLIWLGFYLRNDVHPEPNKLIIKVFLLGIISGFLAIFLEMGAKSLIGYSRQASLIGSIVYIFFGIAAIEEAVKYLAVRVGVYKNIEFDEPLDILLYMIISALGFAALENILSLSTYHPFLTLKKTLEVVTTRFISTTFLHALTSAVFGYFIALSFYHIRYRHLLFFTGFIVAVSLHSVYNFFIMKLEDFLVPAIILILLALFISYAIKKVKKLKSVCLINSDQ